MILDALNRSQNERDNVDTVPGLSTQHYQHADESVFRWQKALPWVALLLALLCIVWLLWGRAEIPPEGLTPVSSAPVLEALDVAAAKSESESEIPQLETKPPAGARIAVQVKNSAAAIVPAAVLAPSGPATESLPVESSTQVSALYAMPADNEIPFGATPKVEELTPAVVASVTAVAEPKREAAVPAVSREVIDIESMISKAEGELKNKRLEEHPAPFLSDLSQQAKDRIPTIMYSRHDYSGEPKQSSVVLNGKKLKAGNKVSGEVKLVEILADSIVLGHRDTQFRLRALNSWINL